MSEQTRKKQSRSTKESHKRLYENITGAKKKYNPANVFLSPYQDDLKNETENTENKKMEKSNVVQKEEKKVPQARQAARVVDIKRKKEEDLTNELEVLNLEVKETDDHFWESLKKGKREDERNKVMTTFYLDPDLDDVISYLHEREGKGFKSKFLNESIRFALRMQGLI